MLPQVNSLYSSKWHDNEAVIACLRYYYIYICNLFSDAVSNSDYLLDDSEEYEMEAEESSCGHI